MLPLRQPLMKVRRDLPSDLNMALCARHSCRHCLPLILAASAAPAKTARLRAVIKPKWNARDICFFMLETFAPGLCPGLLLRQRTI